MLIEAKRGPLACGAKSTIMLHEAAGPMPEPPTAHVLWPVIWKSPGLFPARPMLLKTRLTFPLLVTVIACVADVLPTATLPNVSVGGLPDGVIVAIAPAPVPMTEINCGLETFEELSVMLTLAFAAPTAVGAKSMAIKQEPPFGPMPAPPIGQVVAGLI